METGPVRSQPLHNFALPFLKWGNNLHRKLLDSSQQQQESSSPVDHNSSSSSETQVEAINGGEKEQQPEFQNRKNSIASRSVKNRSSPSFSSPLLQKKNPTLSESEIGVNEVKSNSVSRHRSSNKDEVMEKIKSEGGEGVVEVGESTPKPWNLRPRRVFIAPTENNGGGASKNSELREKPENLPKSLRLRGFVEGQNVENKEKRKFWISLSREEIEVDFFVMTGSKPPRRPKKRAKSVQNQVDNVFPGLWLVGASADSYTVPDGPAKR